MPKHIDAANAGNTIHYMGTYKSMTPATKSKIAKSPKLKTFLLALVDHDPITLEMTLKVVMRKCTRLHKRAIAAKKKVQKRKQIGECAPPTRRAKFARFHMTPSTVPHTAGITAKGITKNGEQPSGPAKDDDPPDTFKHDSEGLVPKLEPEDMPDSGWKDLSAAQVSLSKDRALANDKYRIEVGLTRRTSSVIDNIKDQCLDLPCRPIRIERKKKELQDILDICSTLDFDRARCMLVEFLDNRLELPGGGIGRPPKWIDISKPYEIFDALQMIKANGMDAKMHRAYGQMRLCESVDAKASDRTALSKMKGNGSHIAAHLVVLEKLAKDHAGPMAEKERSQLCSNYRSEYYAGKRWLEMAKGFGGTGIALVFLCAGIGNWYIAQSWTDYQRSCLLHISNDLHSMKQLVEALGDNALERYCTSGHLDEETVAKIEGVAGCLAFDADEDEPEDDDMSDGNGDEGADGSDGDDFQITDENASEPDE